MKKYFFLFFVVFIIQKDLCGQFNPCSQIIIPADSSGIYAFSGYNGKKDIVDSLCLHIPVEYSFAVKIPKEISVLPIGNSMEKLPATLKYSCFPSDCQFKKSETGCITIKGKFDDSYASALFKFKLEVPDSFGIQLNDFGFYLRSSSSIVCKTSSLHLLGATRLKINAYPNPFSDNIQIHILTELSGLFDLQLYNMDGRIVERRRINLNPGNNRFEFPTKDVPSGIYGCSLTDGFSTVSMRLSKL
ncbi:MAG: hypothetical protein RLZZ417_572 [Bacteroidota bacterium]|jgi:hypothetical protein